MKCLKVSLIVSVCFMLMHGYAFANAFQWDSGYKSDAPDADEIDVSVTNFAGLLSAADSTTQKALDTLDDVAVGTIPTTFTANSVPYSDGSNLVENNPGLTYDGTDFTVGGTATIGGSGQSTLNSGLIINESGADSDTRIEGDTEQNLFVVDASDDQVDIADLLVNATLNLTSGSIVDTGAAIIMGGTGSSSTETMTWTFGNTSNVIGLASATGVTRIQPSFDIRYIDDFGTQWGAGADMKSAWETTGNDNFQLGVRVGSADDSGYINIMEGQDMGGANRSPAGTSADPVLRIYSSDQTVATDYIEIFHDQSTGTILSGTGNISFGDESIATSYYATTGYYTNLTHPGSGAPVGSIITFGGDGSCGGAGNGITVAVCVSDGTDWIPV